MRGGSRWLIERRYGFGVGSVTLPPAPIAKAPRPAPGAPGASVGMLASFLLFSAGVVSIHRQSLDEGSDLEVAWLEERAEPVLPEPPLEEPEPEPELIPQGDDTSPPPAPEVAEIRPEPTPPPPRAEPRVERVTRVAPPSKTRRRIEPAPPPKPSMARASKSPELAPPSPPKAPRAEPQPPRDLGSFPEAKRFAAARGSCTPLPRRSGRTPVPGRHNQVPAHIALPEAKAEAAADPQVAVRPTRAARSRPRAAAKVPASVALPTRPAVEQPVAESAAPARAVRTRPLPRASAPKVAVALPSTQTERSTTPVAITPPVATRSARALPRAGRGGSSQGQFEGVPLASLASCRDDRDEDRLKMAVLGSREGRQSCRSAAGAFHFVEAKNLNAFLLSIERSPDRPLEDRCGELAHVLKCLSKEGAKQ